MHLATQFGSDAGSCVLRWLFTLCLAGLSASAQIKPPPDMFSLSARPRVEGEEMLEARFNLLCPGGKTLEFEHVGALQLESGWSPDSNVTNRVAEIRVSLNAKGGKHEVAVRVVTSSQSSGMSVTNSNFSHYQLEPAQLEKVKTKLDVTATNGFHRLNMPIKLGTFLDKPLQITVRSKPREN